MKVQRRHASLTSARPTRAGAAAPAAPIDEVDGGPDRDAAVLQVR